MGAKFVAFVVGALAAAIIALALVDERLLEAHIHVRCPSPSRLSLSLSQPHSQV
jgi:hypothetical protein